MTAKTPKPTKRKTKIDPLLEAALASDIAAAEAPEIPDEPVFDAADVVAAHIEELVPALKKPAKIKPPKKERSKTTKGHYVSNAQLLEGFYESKAAGKLTNKMAKYLELVAERYSYHPWFANYSFREDLVRTAVVNLVANWHKFNPEKQENPNPFSYYTTASYRSFLSYLDAERKERDIRDELLIEAGANPSFNYQSKHGISGRTSDDTAFSGGGGGDE